MRATAAAVAEMAGAAVSGPRPDPEGGPETVPGGLSARLFATAGSHPQRTAFRDAGDRLAWCGRPAITWTYATAAEIVGRLARGIGGWRLPPGSRIGLWFSGGAESALAYLAVEAAGHLPCPMPAAWDRESLSAGIEAAGLVAVLTEGRRGLRRPAEDLAHTARGHFGLRYLAAFGPAVPDGVISLDAMALEGGAAGPKAGPSTSSLPKASLGLATFAGGDPTRPVFRDASALSAAIEAHCDALPVACGARILTLLPGHDLRGLVTGLGATLSVGASLESLIPFEEAGFRTALARPVPTRLVIPALFEPALADIPLPWTIRAVDSVHRAATSLTARIDSEDPAGPRRLDCLALGEDAVLTRPRGESDLAATLARPERSPLPRTLLALAHGPDGGLRIRGPASASAALHRGTLPDPDPTAWRALSDPAAVAAT